ncbi:uncharacterized protein I206_104680 [Kwoniella pini CBS 10737]|uniref:BAR domain-containing protein n=1 Tax=Kwoniella pini CBS 10737 TaxID=1296096 RepID=A0A1B9I7K7_9TREE|nr:uncharacterized protein I206_02218 [Kwoniella pini CBS 10737]OCF51504.1 hypothetical protein I206_02218 [Kwoniella pini CBS 10737]
MQRKALKQLGKVTQWTNEKVFSGEKTNLSSEFTDFEKEIDVRRIGIERLHATSLPFYNQLIKVKPTTDPFPPPGSGKDKITYTEALGLVMIDYGDEIGEEYGDGLSKYGRARCRLAAAQEDFSAKLGDGYIAGMEAALSAVNEYKALRKKLDSRRLALDAAISKAQNSKKDQYALEEEINIAKARFEEIEEETQQRMIGIQETEERQISELKLFLEAELEYHSACHDILNDLHGSWGGSSRASATRARSNTATSSKSLGRTAVTRSHTTRHGLPQSSDDEGTLTANRSRSHSNASASSAGKTKEKRSILPSFGSFGKKSGLSAATSSHKKKSSYGKEKFNDSKAALNSEDSEDDDFSSSYGRTRSTSQLSASSSLRQDTYQPPVMRRALTSPPNPTARYADPNTQYVKALYDYSGKAADELTLKVGQVIEVTTQVSDDWWIGECDGKSGLFPKAYTEEYVPTPQTAVPPPMPNRRLPPSSSPNTTHKTILPLPAATNKHNNLPPSPEVGYGGSEFDFESELESDVAHGFSDGDHNATASLSAEAHPVATTGTRSRSNTLNKKAAPPPPPSRRSASSNNLLTISSFGSSPSNSGSALNLAPPVPVFGRNRSNTATKVASPFAGSEDDESDHEVTHNNNTASNGSTLSSGLSSMHLSQSAGGVNTGQCGICGCHDFTQNVFKSKGVCSTCFHEH